MTQYPGIPGTETPPERNLLERERDKRCHFSGMAVPILIQKTLDSDATL